MAEIWNSTLFSLGSFELTFGKIIELFLLLVLVRYGLRFYGLFITRSLAGGTWMDEERERRLRRAGRWAIIGLAVIIAFYRLGLSVVLDSIYDYSLFTMGDKVRLTVGNLIVLGIILYASRFVVNLVQVFLRRNLARRGWNDEGREYTVLKLSRYLLYILAFFIGVQSLGIDISLVLGGMAALLVGIGLGLQNLFNDIVSGFILLFEGSLRVGDVIEINNLVARVQQIDIRTSKVITRDGNYIIVPNSKLTSDNIINWSHGSKLTRFNIRVRVALGSDTNRVREVLYNCALRHPDVSKNREIIVRFEDFGENGLIFEVYFWAKKTWMVETLKSEIRFEIDRKFREEGIVVPYPQRVMRWAEGDAYYPQTSGKPTAPSAADDDRWLYPAGFPQNPGASPSAEGG